MWDTTDNKHQRFFQRLRHHAMPLMRPFPLGPDRTIIRRSGGHPDPPYFPRSSSRRWAMGRIVIFIAAGLLTALILVDGPRWIGNLATTFFSVPPYQPPIWVSRCLYAIYAFFVLSTCFPFLLTVGWMLMARFQHQASGATPFVSLIIPAFNEEQCIHRSLAALRHLNYPAFEVIVVNDGSTDFTFSLIERAFVKCIQLRRNQGKAAALNAGIARARGDIVVFSDSDSWLDPMALRYLVAGFADASIGAVAGTVEIARPTSLLKRWQSIEYIYGQFMVKVAQIGSGSTVAICPGPVCAYRRDLLLAIGGFKGRTLTEDFDATLMIIRQGYRVVYAPRALAYTEAPSSWNELKSQRLRWCRGHLQVVRQHRGLLGTRQAGALSIYWLPIYYLLLGYGCGLIEMVAIPAFPLLIFASGNPWGMLQVTALYLVFAELFVMLGCTTALGRAKMIRPGLLAAALIIYPYLLFLNWTRFKAMVNEAKGKLATWSG